MTFKESLANHVLGIISTQQLIDAATDALVEGWDSTSLRLLAAENEEDYNPQRIINLLNASLTELKITLPSKESAMWAVLCQNINDIAEETVQAREGMKKIMYFIDFPRSTKYFGDSHDVHELIGNYYAHDDLVERPDEVSCDGKYGQAAHDVLDDYIVKLAKNWVKKHCNQGKDG